MKQRIAKKIDGEIAEKYLWLDLTTLLAVYDKNDNLVQRFEYANGRMPVAMTDANGTKYYLHYDQVGSLRAVSNQNGNVVKEIVYDTFGNIISDSNKTLKIPFGFAGGLYDPDTKLIHFGFREYDPFIGRWTAKDPILFAGGDSNLYGYVLGDPVSGVDALGLWAVIDDLIFSGGGAIVGLIGQLFSDFINSKFSGWEDYTGAAVGGAVFGEVLLYAGPVTAGLAGGAVTNATKQGLKNFSKKQCGFNEISFIADMIVGGLTGFIPGMKISGITAGRGNMNAIFKQISTKFIRGQILHIHTKTALKMLIGRATDTAVLQGVAVGTLSGVYVEPFIPGYSDYPSCGCQ
jgi:type VI secretion system secreted protein VgrG